MGEDPLKYFKEVFVMKNKNNGHSMRQSLISAYRITAIALLCLTVAISTVILSRVNKLIAGESTAAEYFVTESEQEAIVMVMPEFCERAIEKGWQIETKLHNGLGETTDGKVNYTTVVIYLRSPDSKIRIHVNVNKPGVGYDESGNETTKVTYGIYTDFINYTCLASDPEATPDLPVEWARVAGRYYVGTSIPALISRIIDGEFSKEDIENYLLDQYAKKLVSVYDITELRSLGDYICINSVKGAGGGRHFVKLFCKDDSLKKQDLKEI